MDARIKSGHDDVVGGWMPIMGRDAGCLFSRVSAQRADHFDNA